MQSMVITSVYKLVISYGILSLLLVPEVEPGAIGDQMRDRILNIMQI